MNFRLRIEPKDFLENGSGGRRFSFVVVDLDRSGSYPQNFVCMLPVHLGRQGRRAESAFERVFGDKSLEQAKTLLAEALQSEDDRWVKVEIKRRLTLLQPEHASSVKCSGCGKPFKPGWTRRFRRKFCPECMAKKYGSRA